MRWKVAPCRRESTSRVQVDGYSLDVQDMLKDLLADTLQGMLEAEMDDYLGNFKYAKKELTKQLS